MISWAVRVVYRRKENDQTQIHGFPIEHNVVSSVDWLPNSNKWALVFF